MPVNEQAQVSHIPQSPSPALEVRGISKHFGAVVALDDVSLELYPGEVLGLLGDNGAGKSTLVKCMSGLYRPDAGSFRVHGREVELGTPDAAREAGIETVHQGLAIVPHLDIAANMYLNREITYDWQPAKWLGLLNKRKMYQSSRSILDRLHVRVSSVRMRMTQLSGGQRQAVALGRAVEWSEDIVLLDEPTAALGVEQSSTILDLIRRLAGDGIAVLLISHNMQDVVSVCDRAVVLRHGKKVGDVSIDDVSAPDLVDLITGARRFGEADEPS